MDLLKVDSSTWKLVGSTIKHYESLIWTERFQEPGDFELKSYAVDYTRNLLPLGTLITHLQTREVFMVEKETIDTDDRGVELLTLSGKSITSFTDHRVIGFKRGNKFKGFSHSALVSALRLIENAFKNGTAWDLILQPPAANQRNPKDQIPNTIVSEATGELEAGTQGPAVTRYFDPGPVTKPFRELLNYRPYGFRVVRPPHDAVYYINVDSGGSFTRTWIYDDERLLFEIYLGIDKSHTQTAAPVVIFDTQFDDVISPNYVFSLGIYKSEAHIVLDDKAVHAYNPQAVVDGVAHDTKQGLDRRVLYLDGGNPEDGYSAAEWEEAAIDEGERTLRDYPRAALIDGEVSSQSVIKFGQDYFLGDTVSVRGKYGPLARARVTEYIRTEDMKGQEEGYPGLTYL